MWGRGYPGYTSCEFEVLWHGLVWEAEAEGLTQVLPCGPKGLALPERPQPEEAAEDGSYKTQINLTLPC